VGVDFGVNIKIFSEEFGVCLGLRNSKFKEDIF
jgi:hypothetical protein